MELSLASELDIEIPSWALSSHKNGSRFIFAIDPKEVSSTIEWAKRHVNNGLIMDYSLSPTTIEDAYIELTSTKVVV